MTLPTVNDFQGRPLINDTIRAAIKSSFAAVPEGKRGALLVIADEQGSRGMLAFKVGREWKVMAGGGFEWHAPKPMGYVAVEGTW